MCGICGIWGEVDQEAVARMVGAMHHRGPDDRGAHHETGVSLGMSRLVVIDPSAAARQPMSNPDQTVWMVYNGEVYNYQSERRLLETKGYRFSSASDTEVVLRMYEHYGDDFLLRLRGMFALAIYDKREGSGRERLLLARDHMGIKPLLYARVGSRLVFASEIKALLASGLVKPEIDPAALRLLLTFGSVYQPRTILRGVSMLLPAHRMIVSRGQERVERYWSLGIDRQAGLRKYPYEELVARVRSALEESVRMQLVSDVPLGAFLSGGVDSSLLVAMMAREIDRSVKTFSVGFEAEGAQVDESDAAEQIARFLGTDHSLVLVRGQEVRDRIQHIAFSLDQPSVDGVNAYFVSLAARQGVTVAVSGTGGDEIYAGYPWFINMVQDQMHRSQNPWTAAAWSLLAAIARRPIFDALLPGSGGDKLNGARTRAGFVARHARNHQVFGAAHAARLITPELRGAAQAGRSAYYDLAGTDELPMGSTIERLTGLCLRGYTSNQLLRDIDVVSMAHSLEVRVPYLDPVVVDQALSLPDSTKLSDRSHLSESLQSSYRESGAKRILIDAGRPLLPAGLDLQPKRGFIMPFDPWLRGSLREVLLDTLSETGILGRGLLDLHEVSAVKDRFLAGSIAWSQPWLLMMLELWCRQVLDRPPSSLAGPQSSTARAMETHRQ